MKILILGSGAREYAIALALKKENASLKLFFAPGNGASTRLGENVNLKDIEAIVSFAKEQEIDFSIVGSEDFLSAGIVDVFEKNKLLIFGPSKAAARLEASKNYMKDFLKEYEIKTARYLNTSDFEAASAFIKELNLPVVIKADGLCAGKGVIIAQSHEEALSAAKEMLSGKSFGVAGQSIVVEEFLKGFELSIFALSDGQDFVLLPAAQDHKRLLDNDKGPNTGGMGAYAPSTLATPLLLEKIKKDIITPTLKGMKERGAPFRGVLFAGIMVVKNEPFVLEFNVRFGDPECEVLMPLIQNPLELMLACAKGKLKEVKPLISDEFAVGVVCASANYPYKSSPKEELIIKEIPPHTHLDFAGVSEEGGKLFASGGRICVCVGLAKSIKEAQARAYALCKSVEFKGKQFRKDIAAQALAQFKDENAG